MQLHTSLCRTNMLAQVKRIICGLGGRPGRDLFCRGNRDGLLCRQQDDIDVIIANKNQPTREVLTPNDLKLCIASGGKV